MKAYMQKVSTSSDVFDF